MDGLLALHAFAIDQSRRPNDPVDAFDASSGTLLMGHPPSSPSYMRDSPEAEIASGDPESPPSKKVWLVRPNPTVQPPTLDLNVPFVPLESLPGTRRWPYSSDKARIFHVGRSQSESSAERGISPSRSMSPVTLTQSEGPCPFKEEGSAGDHWHHLLHKHPESTRELLFRLPWYTAPGRCDIAYWSSSPLRQPGGVQVCTIGFNLGGGYPCPQRIYTPEFGRDAPLRRA